jgi:hypothetical protein
MSDMCFRSSYTTNWLNGEVNRNYTHRCSFRTSTLSNLELLWGDRKNMSDIAMRRRFNVFFLHFVVTFYILLFTTYFLNISQGHLTIIFYSIYLFILFVILKIATIYSCTKMLSFFLVPKKVKV